MGTDPMNRLLLYRCLRNAGVEVVMVLLVLGQASTLQSDPLRTAKRSPMDLRIAKRSPIDLRLSKRSPMDLRLAKRSPMDLRLAKRSPMDLRLAKRSPVDPRLAKRSPMDLRLAKRSPMDLRISRRSVEPEDVITSFDDIILPGTDDKRSILRLSKRDVLRLSKRDLLRLSKKDVLRLSKRDLLRLSKRAEDEDSMTEDEMSKRLAPSLRLSKRNPQTLDWAQLLPAWQMDPLDTLGVETLEKRDKPEVPMIIHLSKRELGHLLQLQQELLEGGADFTNKGLRISKRSQEQMIE